MPHTPSEAFWGRALLGLMLGILVGTFNRDALAAFFGDSTWVHLSNAAFSGVVASAVQGLFLRQYTRPPWLWLSVGAVAWAMAIGLPEVLVPQLSDWLCDRLGRWMLTGALSGACIGSIQATGVWRYTHVLKGWILLHMLVWMGMWALPVLLFGGLMGGEGVCLASFPW